MHTDRCLLTILTPTFNRADRLPALAESLDAQTVKGFQWLVIDDGSTDGTGDYIRGLRPEGYAIDYHYKENGGKHTAINFAHAHIRGDYVCIVDSDDALLPDAVAAIIGMIETYGGDQTIACLSFQKGSTAGHPMVQRMPETPVVSNHIEYRLNGRRFGDCCEVVRASALREFPFPVFPGERFLGEGYLWVEIGKKYRTVYCNRVIYICEYLEDGLTRSGRGMRLKSPLGGMALCNAFLSVRGRPRLSARLTHKQLWLYICYGKYAGLGFGQLKARCARPGMMALNYPMGLLLYRLFRKKYG